MTETLERHGYRETPREIIIPKDRIFRAWAAKNAYLLGAIVALFIITWIYMFVILVAFGGQSQ